MKTKSGWRALDGARSPSASSRPPAAAPARSPQVRSKMSFIISIAMSQRTPSHCSAIEPSVSIDGAAQVGRERVQLHDVGPRREVRVAAVRQHAVADLDERGRVALEVVVAALRRSTPGAPPSTGGRARRGSARSRGSAAGRARRAPCAPRRGPSGPPRCVVDRVVADAVRRADHVVARVKSGQRAPEALEQARRSASAIAIPAGLRSQTPISQTASNPSAAIASHSRRGHAGEADLLAPRAPQLVEPDPGVDLVDEGMLDHGPPAGPARRPGASMSRCRPGARARAGAVSPGGPRWVESVHRVRRADAVEQHVAQRPHGEHPHRLARVAGRAAEVRARARRSPARAAPAAPRGSCSKTSSAAPAIRPSTSAATSARSA